MSQSGEVATLVLAVQRPAAGWELYEGTVPESVLHAQAVDLLNALLLRWARQSGAMIVRSLGIRWVEEKPRIGVDPDVAVLLPAPPDGASLRSLRTWIPGHEPPLVAIEIVSESHPDKDYSIAPAKYAASGTKELWIFDPLLCGPKSVDGPFRLQLWRADEHGQFARIYAGTGPARSPALDAWVVVTDDGRKLRVARDEAATDFWLTDEESERAAKESERAAKERERAAKERERAAKESERAAKEAALARVAELEAELARRG